MLPIGCEMTRGLAQLLQKTNYEFEPKLVRRMLNIFEERLIEISSVNQSDKNKRVAWNFDGSPDPNKPCLWVTAVSVLAIDRVVRMLNERINSIIFKYFEVIRPEKPHSTLTLNDLVYPDHGFSEYHEPRQLSMALRLEQMRAHAMRVTLPKMYQDERGEKERVFSAIFYGPPGTGKTTLVEALALSGNAPLIRLSPSDLVVQGPAAIEGRARTVFEALSMLTQVVIILDEFEDVVGWREQPDDQKQKNEAEIFGFLRTGMLPKLVKLHDSARKQSIVYCLATNYLSKIDPAAKRKGRFDLHLPVYDPDPMSRAGALLYRLWRVARRLNKAKDFRLEPTGMTARFIEVVGVTSNTHASRLAEDYLRLPRWEIHPEIDLPDNYKEDIAFFWYILTGDASGYERKKELLEEEKQKAKKEQAKMREQSSQDEKNEYEWLDTYEAKVKKMRVECSEKSTQEILSCLIGQS
jgi:DNA polymerase III delta prime subunit